MKYEGILKRTVFVILFAFILCVVVKETTVDSSAYGYNILSDTKVTLIKGESKKIKLLWSEDSVIKWSTSNKKVATVKNGKITAKKKGTAYITAKIRKKKYKCKVKVEEPKLSDDELEFLLDDKPKQIRLNGTNRKVKWRTSNKSVATVSNGIVTPKGKGYCSIYAKVGNMEYRCDVDVKNEMNTVYIPMGKSWNVPGQWNIRINSVEETSYRSEYSEYNPEAVYILEYTYRNLGYEDVDGLYISLDTWSEAIVDKVGEVAYWYYPYDITWYPKKLPIGAYCTAEASIGVEHRGNFKIYYNMYDNEDVLRKAVFEVKVSN